MYKELVHINIRVSLKTTRVNNRSIKKVSCLVNGKISFTGVIQKVEFSHRNDLFRINQISCNRLVKDFVVIERCLKLLVPTYLGLTLNNYSKLDCFSLCAVSHIIQINTNSVIWVNLISMILWNINLYLTIVLAYRHERRCCCWYPIDNLIEVENHNLRAIILGHERNRYGFLEGVNDVDLVVDY